MMDTMPKLVNLKTWSMIHMILGKTFKRGLNVDINIGTSAVDWWLAMTRVRSSVHLRMSSPSSTTVDTPLFHS